ncbi:TIGR02147 family protein [Bacteriovorax sp. PP10]|uniref:TIGR02147 family protein n=1 Tax=Bacteriovorax antarcticus TaxID=3088717 RepID=A0ABU5W2V2_9BACT|nr:TIGR02147 family protein [Bacteriovorax sp. PP10]MEA9358140.1 TIGR02147 family protein [Bacteriovorax sp. PP10]
MKDIVEIINQELSNKLENNPKYSLRAYANYLGISPASLSRILSGQTKVTPKIFKVIGDKLNLGPSQMTQMLSSLQLKKIQGNIRNVEHRGMSAIEMEKFNLIADWYHYAILHMCSLEDFNKDPKWIAKRLGIKDVTLIKQAITRLLENKLMGIDEEDNYYRVDEFTAILDYSFSSIAMRERQKQVLKLSAEKIDTISIHKRDHSTITIQVDEKLLPEIKDRIKKFRRTLGNYIVKNNLRPEQIYELQISFFPLLENE